MENKNGRSMILPMLALIKKNIVSAFESITKSQIFRFKLEDNKELGSYLSQIESKLDTLNRSITNLPKIEMKDSPASIQIQTMGKETINKIVQELSSLKEIAKSNKFIPPKVQEVRGQVELKNQQYFPFDRLLMTLKSIEQRVGNLKIELPKTETKEIKLPEFPKQMQVLGIEKVIDAISALKEEINKLPKKYPKIDFPTRMQTEIVAMPPQKYPLPATHISINALAGTVKTTAITVTTSLTPLPSEVLAYRRSLVVYNNSSQTVEVGGSTFTFGNGLPVPAGTYSPAFDSGEKMIVYGRVSSGTADVRTMEVSDLNIGR